MFGERFRNIINRVTRRGEEQTAVEPFVPVEQAEPEPLVPQELQQSLAPDQVKEQAEALIAKYGSVANAITMMELAHDVEDFKAGNMSRERYEQSKRELDEFFDLRGRHGKRNRPNANQDASE